MESPNGLDASRRFSKARRTVKNKFRNRAGHGQKQVPALDDRPLSCAQTKPREAAHNCQSAVRGEDRRSSGIVQSDELDDPEHATTCPRIALESRSPTRTWITTR